MPNCDFYATPQDHEGILFWLLDDGACEVYESYSRYGQELRRLRSTSDVLEKFEERYVTGDRVTSVLLDLYVVGAGPPFVARRIELNPESCGGATFRYAADGWGLVQLQLSAQNQKNGLENSHTNHNTRKRAEAWAAKSEEQGGRGLGLRSRHVFLFQTQPTDPETSRWKAWKSRRSAGGLQVVGSWGVIGPFQQNHHRARADTQEQSVFRLVVPTSCF